MLLAAAGFRHATIGRGDTPAKVIVAFSQASSCQWAGWALHGLFIHEYHLGSIPSRRQCHFVSHCSPSPLHVFASCRQAGNCRSALATLAFSPALHRQSNKGPPTAVSLQVIASHNYWRSSRAFMAFHAWLSPLTRRQGSIHTFRQSFDLRSPSPTVSQSSSPRHRSRAPGSLVACLSGSRAWAGAILRHHFLRAARGPPMRRRHHWSVTSARGRRRRRHRLSGHHRSQWGRSGSAVSFQIGLSSP